MTFTVDASAALPGPDWLVRARQDAFERFASSSLPSPSEDLWKYSDISRLDLDRHTPEVRSRPADELKALVEQARSRASGIGEWSGLVVAVDGHLVDADALGDSSSDVISIRAAGEEDQFESVRVRRDALDDLHSAFVRDVIEVEIKAKSSTENPVLVWHWLSGPGWGANGLSAAHFPHLRVHVGASAEAKVVEVFAGVAGDPGGPLVFPVTELDLAENARLSYATMQILSSGSDHFAVQSARVERDASLHAFCGSLGAQTSRLRADAELVGQGAEAVLTAGYMGVQDQLHDLRTIQDHVAPRTHSQLLCMGAVADVARSAYVGLTRVRNGAHGADAFQTNHNLVLSEGAHADSVPNLDIEENDVRCSHASTVGPIDEEQLYYLESRGIEPRVAERLIVLGFFRSLAERSPIASIGNWFVDIVSGALHA